MSARAEKLVASRSVFEGKLVRVRIDTVSLSDGRQATREVVEHSQSVVIVPVEETGNAILVRQYRHAVGRELLEAPAGRMEPSEDPDQCAQRELQEETGFRAGDLLKLGAFWTAPGIFTEYMHAYLARDLRPSRLQADPDEQIVTERVPLSRVGEMVRNGEIQDAKTIAALCMAGHLLSEG